MSIYTVTEAIAANSGQGHYESWFGCEVLSAAGYNVDTTVVTGGGYVLSGPGAADVTILPTTGVHGGPLDSDFPYGDYGYHVNFRQAPGADTFTLEVTTQYVA